MLKLIIKKHAPRRQNLYCGGIEKRPAVYYVKM